MAKRKSSSETTYRLSKRMLELRRSKIPQYQDNITPVVQRKIKSRSDVVSEPTQVEGSVLQQHVENGDFRFSTGLSPKKGEETQIQKLNRSITTLPKELPDIPEYLRDFAFRYATEYRTHMDWARIYNRSIFTIRLWLSKPDVLIYVKMIKRERNRLMAARLDQLEKKAYQKYSELLDMPLTADTAEIIRSAIHDILLLKQGSFPTDKRNTLIQVNNQNQLMDNQSLNSGAIEKSVVNISDLKKDLDELKTIADILEE